MHQVVVTDETVGPAEVSFQIDHDAAALHAGGRHVFDAQPPRALRRRHRAFAAIAIIDGTDHILAGAKAVVIDHLRPPIGVGIEVLADMGEAVPLGGVLQRHLHDVVARHVEQAGIVTIQRIVDVGHAFADGRQQLWRMAPGIDHGAARQVERQAQTKTFAGLDLGDALHQHIAGQQGHPSQLVVGTEVAPVGTLRTSPPAHRCHHLPLPSVILGPKRHRSLSPMALKVGRAKTETTG